MVPKKGGFTMIRNERNELIPTRTVIGWRVCIDCKKLNTATQKDHFPLPFIDHMLDRSAGHPHLCFLNGYSGYNQIDIALEVSRPDSRSDSIGESEPVPGTRDHILGLFT